MKKTKFEHLREKIHEAQNEIEPQESSVSNAFYCALKSVLQTMDEIDYEYEFKIGNFYFAWNFIEQGFIYGKLIEIDEDDEDLPYKIDIGGSTQIWAQTGWYEYISVDLPKHLITALNK
jgi:hypothetical protein